MKSHRSPELQEADLSSLSTPEEVISHLLFLLGGERDPRNYRACLAVPLGFWGLDLEALRWEVLEDFSLWHTELFEDILTREKLLAMLLVFDDEQVGELIHTLGERFQRALVRAQVFKDRGRPLDQRERMERRREWLERTQWARSEALRELTRVAAQAPEGPLWEWLIELVDLSGLENS